MERIKLAVLFGGCSTEYGVSLQSAYSVIRALDPKKYEPILLGITRQGAWLRYEGPIEKLLDDTWQQCACSPAIISADRDTHGILQCMDGSLVATRIDAAFPVLHGKNGEDGTVQGLLTMAGIPFAGCGTLGSAICMDKDVAHRLAQHCGISVPRSVVLCRRNIPSDLQQQIDMLQYPLFIKPANAGSSIGITKVLQKSDLPSAIESAFEHDDKILVEQAVDGFEVGCAVLGNEDLTIGEIDEIELLKGFFDFAEKYTLKTSKIHMPARIDEKTQERVKSAATQIYRALCCSGFARIDFFLTPDNDIVFNEVNTIPGFTSHSRFPGMLFGIGMSFERIVDESIRLAMRK